MVRQYAHDSVNVFPLPLALLAAFYEEGVCWKEELYPPNYAPGHALYALAYNTEIWRIQSSTSVSLDTVTKQTIPYPQHLRAVKQAWNPGF